MRPLKCYHANNLLFAMDNHLGLSQEQVECYSEVTLLTSGARSGLSSPL